MASCVRNKHTQNYKNLIFIFVQVRKNVRDFFETQYKYVTGIVTPVYDINRN